jgi:hypothetical protein
MSNKTTIIPEIIAEAEDAGCENDAQIIGFLAAEVSRLRAALDRIARPVWWMQEDQKRRTGSIKGISGSTAVALSESAEFLKSIAKQALAKGESK